MFIVLTAWWLWITLAAVVLLLICEANEKPVAAFFIFAAALLLYQFVADVNIFKYVKDNPLAVLGWVNLYLAVGVVWGAFKWWLYALGMRDEYRELKRSFLSARNLKGDKVPLSLKDEWLKETEWKFDFPPKVYRNKSRIIRWMAYWPTSMLWTMLDDFLKRLYSRLYNMVSATLQKVSDRAFAKDMNDFE